jgi:hypothetical protein
MFNRLAILSVLSVIVASCESPSINDNDVAQNHSLEFLPKFDDGSWIFHINRAWIKRDKRVTYPSDQLVDADYQPVSCGPTYPVVVSDRSIRIFVGNHDVDGHRTYMDAKRIIYNLDGGAFAGGRFVVWSNNQGLQAEITIYGSGVPIIKSERGVLVKGS